MSVFLDTSFVVALKNPRDPDHARAVELFQEILRGAHGAAHSTDMVVAEAVTLARTRTKRHGFAVSVGEFFFLSWEGHALTLLHYLTPTQLQEAWKEFRKHSDRDLSLVDWTSVAVARGLELDSIASFDEGFDGVFSRLF